MTIKLRDLIRNIRSCKTAAEERAVVSKECALIRTSFKEEDNQHRHRNVAKLLFINMLGYSTSFGQLECLKLIASNKFSHKRVGYLALMLLLDENTDVLMLVTNSIKNDLSHPNQYVNGLALCALGNVANAEMCRALAREVEELMSVSNPYVRKKAALCAMRMIRRVEEVEDKFNVSLVNMLNDKNHGVLLSAISVIITLLEVFPQYTPYFRNHVPQLVKILRNLSISSGGMGRGGDEIGGIGDPLLQVKTLRLLAKLAKGHDETIDMISDILAQVTTNTESGKNVGNAILYECAQTIVYIQPSDDTLRILGTNVLCRFLQHRDNNIKYVALSTLQHVVAVDAKTVQRHRSTIVECLKDPDVSIRRRALDVAFALTNEENIKTMIKELLNFLLVADVEFKADLVMKICVLVEKYSLNKKWQVDTIIKVMCLAGNFIQDNVRDAFIHFVASCADNSLHTYTVHKLYFSMKENITQETLVQTAIWCIGEYGDLLVHPDNAKGFDDMPINVTSSEVLSLLESLTKKNNFSSSSSSSSSHSLSSSFPAAAVSPSSSPSSALSSSNLSSFFLKSQTTIEFLVTCLLKLTTRMPNEIKRIRKILQKYEKSMSMEIQQRACEYEELLGEEWDSSRSSILDRMPVVNETKLSKIYNNKNYGKYKAGVEEDSDSNSDINSTEKYQKKTSKISTNQVNDNKAVDLLGLDDLLDLGGEADKNVNNVSSSSSNKNKNSNDVHVLDDLLGDLSLSDTANTRNNEQSNKKAAGGLDGLLLVDDSPKQKAKPNKSENLLDDIFGGGGVDSAMPTGSSNNLGGVIPSSSSSASASLLSFSSPSSPTNAHSTNVFPSITAFKNEKIEVTFSFQKEKAESEQFAILAKYANLTESVITNFNFEVAVPKYLSLEMQSASSNVLEAFGMNEVTQTIKIKRNDDNKKPVLMKLRITYLHNGTPVTEAANVSNFPSGL